jgi:cell division protein FtsB
MKEWKRNKNKFWHSPLILILLLIFVVFFSYNIIDLVKKKNETSAKKELILDEIESLNSRASRISNDIAKLETEEGKEEIIREKYQVAKEGEKMVVIVDSEDTKNEIKREEKTGHGLWNWMKNLFK